MHTNHFDSIGRPGGQQQQQQQQGGGGPAILCGDLNCEPKAPNLRYLERGYTPHGTLRDRNYRMRLSKKAAGALSHSLRFQHAYADQPDCAAVTVSLQGRGPGCMDHLYYTPNLPRKSVSTVVPSAVPVKKGKRSSRRERASTRPYSFLSAQQPNIQVAALLATVDESDPERTQLIRDGLPNESAGFYSDHLPVGALFVPVASSTRSATTTRGSTTTSTSSSGISAQAQQRRATFRKSAVIRQRHNAVLRAIVDTLQQDFVAPILRDVPLYKWPWIQPQRPGRTTGGSVMKKKGRAPDLCCVVDQTLIVLEVTVVAAEKVNDAYQEKRDKYQDVMDILATVDSVAVQQAGLSVGDHALVICLDEAGNLASQSQQDLEHLVKLCGREVDSVTEALVQEFQAICQSFDASPSL
uniref:Endonuclease/exonuclease/phosphatase domain-containing protein n=1 Tax=Amphora coffeiformis TaxID=265554 RepID=A0A7S3L5L5_9STRA